MQQEITKANNEVLIFAAASNTGNVSRITFPANQVGRVICMFATDAYVKGMTSNINPSRNEGSVYNFAILGDNVVSRPKAKPQNGTSMATFIGAAIAGLILDFSRHSDIKDMIISQEYMKTVSGMSAIFAEMSTKEHYDCIAPWQIRSRENLPIARERQFIAGTIARAVDRRFF